MSQYCWKVSSIRKDVGDNHTLFRNLASGQKYYHVLNYEGTFEDLGQESGHVFFDMPPNYQSVL